MGAITHMLTEKSGGTAPAILFDDVPGYPKGFRTLYGQFSSIRRVALTLGLPLDYERKVDIVQRYHARMQEMKPLPPRFVNDGPILQNVIEGDTIDVLKFPVPRHHEHDKARFIGTADCVMTQDPDDGWFNLGAYRAQVYDGKTVGCQITEGKHGRIHRDKIFRARPADEGRDPVRPGPAAVHAVVEPAAGSQRTRHRRRLARRADRRGARALHRLPDPGRLRDRARRRDRAGPGAGRKGRSANGWATTPTTRRPRPYVNIKTILYRNDPILCCAPQHKPVDETGLLKGIAGAAQIWRALDACGVPEVLGVWNHEAGPGDALHRDPDQAALSRPCAPGAAHRGLLPGRRLCGQVDRGGGRGHRRRRARPGAVGDVHALRSARPTSTSSRRPGRRSAIRCSCPATSTTAS